MSQPRKPDISRFFRPAAQVIPQKRATPEPDEDTIVVNRGGQKPLTSSTPRAKRHNDAYSANGTPKRPVKSPLTTPRSGRSVSIPVRSPGAKTPGSIRQPFLPQSSNRKTTSSATATTSSLSFADVHSSIPSSNPSLSRRVEEDGKLVAVRDSDSDDSLGDLSTLFSKPSKPIQHGGRLQSSKMEKQEAERRQLLSQFTTGTSAVLKKKKQKEQEKADAQARQTLRSIFDEERLDRERDDRIAKAEAALQASNQEMDEMREKERDKNLLAAILKGDNEDVGDKNLGRLMEAVDRTELFTTNKAYSFFTRKGVRSTPNRSPKRKKFPSDSIPSGLLDTDETAARDRLFLSGLMVELASSGELDDQALHWTFDAALSEHDEHVQASYLNCVAAGSQRWTRANITPENINNAFANLGAEPEALKENSDISSRVQGTQSVRGRESRSLENTLSVMTAICQDMDFAALSRLCSITTRLSLDHDAANSLLADQAIEKLLYKLIDLEAHESQNHVHERICADLTSNLKEPALQAQFLVRLLPVTPAAARLRMELAARFLLKSDKAEKFLIRPSLNSLKRFVAKSEDFRPRTATSNNNSPEDYHILASLTTSLDVLTADGHRPFTVMTKAEEQEFNAAVDSFADRIQALFVSIADTGASRMRRTEAKDALQALYHRLAYSVRASPKPRKHVFDVQGSHIGSKKKGVSFFRPTEEVEQEERDRKFMMNFVNKRREKSTQEQSHDSAQNIAQSSPAEFTDAMEQQ